MLPSSPRLMQRMSMKRTSVILRFARARLVRKMNGESGMCMICQLERSSREKTTGCWVLQASWRKQNLMRVMRYPEGLLEKIICSHRNLPELGWNVTTPIVTFPTTSLKRGSSAIAIQQLFEILRYCATLTRATESSSMKVAADVIIIFSKAQIFLRKKVSSTRLMKRVVQKRLQVYAASTWEENREKMMIFLKTFQLYMNQEGYMLVSSISIQQSPSFHYTSSLKCSLWCKPTTGLHPSQLSTIKVSALANKETALGFAQRSLIIEKKGSLIGDLMGVSKKYTALSLLIMMISLIFLRLVMTLVQYLEFWQLLEGMVSMSCPKRSSFS